MDFTNFKEEWNGRRVDYDHVYAYQCVDFILQFMKQCAGVPSGIWGNAIDYANKPTAAFLNAVVKVTDNSKQPGDILVFKGLAGNPYGHIGLRDTDLDKMIEQNGHTGNGTGTNKDAIGVYRAIPYDRLIATYRLKKFVDTTPKPMVNGNATEVFLPSTTKGGTWTLYHDNTALRKGTSDQKAILKPVNYPPGLTYKVRFMRRDDKGVYAVGITTSMFGNGTIWIRGTDAVLRYI